jgi:hypothetical protein
MTLRLRWAVLLLACGTISAQTIRVYSELQRIDPSGEIVPADRGKRPREILSPAVVRGAYASFQPVVTAPADVVFWLYVAQNPERTVDVTFYRQVYAKRAGGWIPDGLKRLEMKDSGMVSDPVPRLPGQTAAAYWMDIWVRPATPVGRFRLEVQVNSGGEWTIYPLELRVLNLEAGKWSGHAGPLPPADAPADAAVRGALQAYLCGPGEPAPADPLTIRKLIRRNALQDMTVARTLERSLGREAVASALLELAGQRAGMETWCRSPLFPQSAGAEWYLRVRDYLYRTADGLQSAE